MLLDITLIEIMRLLDSISRKKIKILYAENIYAIIRNLCHRTRAPDVISILSGCLIAWNLCNIVATL